MDKTLILDLSSDDEVGFDNSSSADNFDWVTKLFEDVGGELDDNPVCNGSLFNLGDVLVGDNTNGDSDDSDDVVVVGEVIVPKLKKAKTLVTKNQNDDDDDDDDDDDCVVLDGDPDKPKDEVKDLEDDSDDLLIVGSTGQVACRDYPHPRHLCVKFPFSATSHKNCCEMCHCYVCDTLAPCPLWDSGLSTDHCHASDKEESWKLERKKIRLLKNPTSPMPITKPYPGSLPPCHQLQQRSTGHKQYMRSSCTGGVSSTFGLPNILRSQRSSFAVASNRLQPHVISRQHLRSFDNNTQVQRNSASSLAPRLVPSRPMFKKSGLTSSTVVSNRPSYRTPNNVSVAFLQLPDQQQSGNLTENNSNNSTMSSLHLNLNNICLPSTGSVSPATLPSSLMGYNQPGLHTPTSQFHGCGNYAAVASNTPFAYASMNQAQNVPDMALPCYTNIQNSIPLCSEQQSGASQTISGPNLPSSVPDVLTRITSADQSYSGPIFTCNTTNAMNSLSQSYQQASARENPNIQPGVPMHEFLPSIEQNAQPSGNTEQLDFEFENWLQDGEPILASQESPFFFDMNNQDSVPGPVDADMLSESNFNISSKKKRNFEQKTNFEQKSRNFDHKNNEHNRKGAESSRLEQSSSRIEQVRAESSRK